MFKGSVSPSNSTITGAHILKGNKIVEALSFRTMIILNMSMYKQNTKGKNNVFLFSYSFKSMH